MLEHEIEQTLQSVLPELIDFRRAVHQDPELGFQERNTTQRVKAVLKRHGISPAYIQEQDALGLHFMIEGEQPGDTILLRADMDALPVNEGPGLPFCSHTPGVMHACGHDLNATYALGTAIVLAQHRDMLHGKVKFVFQCAEETLGGAKMALEAGVLDGISPKYGFAFHAHSEHEVGTVAIRCGAAMAASDKLYLTIQGKGGHAAYPHLTVDPVVITAHVILALQTLAARQHHPADPLVITIGKMVAGTASNITPDTAICEGTVRSFSAELRDKLPERIERACRLTAQAYGGDCQVRYEKVCPAIVVGEEMFGAVQHALTQSLGEAHVRRIAAPTMGSEDFGFFAQRMPAMQLRVGTRYEAPESALPLHSAGIRFSEDSIAWGVRAGCTLALRLTEIN